MTFATDRDTNINTSKLEIFHSSIACSCIVSLCFFTLFINIWVCFRIYQKRSLRSSCIALVVANVALVDVLVTIKDFPFLLSVGMSAKWYFETEWCHSYGLTNVVYIIVSISTLVSIATERFIMAKEVRNGTDEYSQNLASSLNNKVILLGYVIAQTTLSYSLSLLWSKYIFLGRKAFCQVEFSPSSFPVSMVVSFLFLIPIATLSFSMLNAISGKNIGIESKTNLYSNDQCPHDNNDEEESRIHSYLQAAIGIFLISWCPYVIDSFFPSTEAPSVRGILSAFIPIMTTSLMPLYFVLTHKPRVTTLCYSSKESSNLLA